jgi:hypothetical protein
MEMESGLDPNIWGGAGGQYRGLIQFGPGARKEVGLPNKPMTIAEQMPYVERYFQQRGFTPGKHGTTELYRTVLVGNPRQSGTDSFGTNSDKAAERMKPGGDLYQRFAGKFDPVASKIGAPGSAGAGAPAVPSTPDGTSTEDALLRQIMGGSSENALGNLGLGSLKAPGLEDIGGTLPGLKLAGAAAPLVAAMSIMDPEAGRMAGAQLQQVLADRQIMQAHGGLAKALMPEIPGLPSVDSGRGVEAMTDMGQVAAQNPSPAQRPQGDAPGIRKTAYGDNVQFETPDGARYRLIHGTKDLKTGTYVQGGWGPQGANQYGDHFDIARVDGGFFDRSALDQFALVNGKPVSAGLTVKGGEFGASRDGGSRVHKAWDYAFGKGARLQLANGARWLL